LYGAHGEEPASPATTLPFRPQGDMCPPGKYYFVSQKAHLFWCVYHKWMIFVRRSRGRTCVPGRNSALRAICAHRQILFCIPKGTSFLVRLPQAAVICTALTVKNLRPRPQLRSEGDMCPQANIFLYPKRHIFFGAFTASG
jgi:hypothetical protein